MAQNEPAKFGTVTVDEHGIKKHKTLFIFGRQFELAWGEITAWSVSEMVMAAGGTRRVSARILELESQKGSYHVSWTGAEDVFNELVNQIRSRLPNRETESALTRYSKLVERNREQEK